MPPSLGLGNKGNRLELLKLESLERPFVNVIQVSEEEHSSAGARSQELKRKVPWAWGTDLWDPGDSKKIRILEMDFS